MIVHFQAPYRNVDPNMGFSLTGIVSDIVKAPLGLVSAVTAPVISTAGGILTQATSAVSPAIQALRPPPAPVAATPPSNLPLYLGGAAALVVLLVLLTSRRSSAPAPAPVGP